MAYKQIQGIYKIVNSTDGLFYIGSTISIYTRWANHRFHLRRDRHPNLYLQHAWNKYGEKSFKIEILEEVMDRDNLIEREQYYLDLYKPFADTGKGYNILKEAGNTLGFKFSPETKALWSKQRTGRKHTPEAKELIRQHSLQHRHSDESKQKMSAGKLGRYVSEEQRQKISQTLRAKDRLWKSILDKYPDRQELITLLNTKLYKDLSILWRLSIYSIVDLRKFLNIGPKKKLWENIVDKYADKQELVNLLTTKSYRESAKLLGCSEELVFILKCKLQLLVKN